MNSGYRAQFNTLDGFTSMIGKTITDVVAAPTSTSETGGKTLDELTERLSLLTMLDDIVGLPNPSLLNGDEKLWMAPIYPFIPRAVWKDKPVLNKGIRLSVALGRPDTTSSAATTIGDLYSLNGTYGVLFGMLIYGACIQTYMNWFCATAFGERKLLVYVLLLLEMTNVEGDIVGIIVSVIQLLVLLMVMSYLLYGRNLPEKRTLRRLSVAKAR